MCRLLPEVKAINRSVIRYPRRPRRHKRSRARLTTGHLSAITVSVGNSQGLGPHRMPTTPLIAYAHVGKTFDGGRVVAVDDVSLEVAEGEFLAIVGGSGSGKTTLLRLANRLIEADAGVDHGRRRGRAQRRSDPAAAADRLRVPERRAVSASDRRRQYRHHAEAARARRPPRFPRGWMNCSTWCGSTARNTATACRTNFPAASASASAWRARSPQSRASC